MKKELTATGIIIKETKVGEGNKIFTLLTLEYGKIQAGGAGVRSYKSKLSAGCSLFGCSDFKLKQGKSPDIYNIVSAEKKMDFFDIRYDVEKLALANYICDLSGKFTQPHQECEGIFKLLANSLYYIEANEFDAKIKSVFELRLMAESGLAPVTDCCTVCGGTENLCAFSVDNAGAECIKCCKEANALSGTLEAMNFILTSPLKNIFNFTASKDVLEQLYRFSEQYIIRQLNHVPRSLTYFKNLQIGNS